MAIEVNLLMHHQVQMKSFYHGYKVANVILVVIFNGSDDELWRDIIFTNNGET